MSKHSQASMAKQLGVETESFNMGKRQPIKDLFIQYTYDLSRFRKLEGNREINELHVKHLESSINANGMLVNAIIVNEQGEVVDGQQRLDAAKKAKSFIYFVVVPGYGIKEVDILNQNQRPFVITDWLNRMADQGKPDYVMLRTFYHKYQTDFSLQNCMAMCSNTTHNNNSEIQSDGNNKTYTSKSVFKKGTWKVKSITQANKTAEKLMDLKPYFKGYNKSHFVGTMITLFKIKEFVFDEFLRRVKSNPGALRECANRQQYKELIEEIYNKRRKDKVSFKYL